jgi:GNAT superfamily N-acetyltransferase
MSVTISTERARMDVAAIHAFLSQESYWAKNIPREVVQRALDHSLCVGAFDGDAQVGFARAVTDYATFAYLADVYVLPSHRGQGLSKRIIDAIVSHSDLHGIRRWHLVTRDAHALYTQFGFHALDAPDRHMMRVRTNPY